MSAKLRAEGKDDKQVAAAIEEATKAGTLKPMKPAKPAGPVGTQTYQAYKGYGGSLTPSTGSGYGSGSGLRTSTGVKGNVLDWARKTRR